jgi:hypothetical protein
MKYLTGAHQSTEERTTLPALADGRRPLLRVGHAPAAKIDRKAPPHANRRRDTQSGHVRRRRANSNSNRIVLTAQKIRKSRFLQKLRIIGCFDNTTTRSIRHSF